jgi:hypothetical protein
VQDARLFGLSEEAVDLIRQALAVPAGGQCEVWAENVEIVEAFLAASTQWRTAPIGGGLAPIGMVWIGLDYAGARVGIEQAGFTITPELWDGVRVMEVAARDALNGRRE